MHRLSSCFVLGYHGCDRDVGERLLAGEAFQPSDNDYDWLGPGSASGRPTRAEVWNSPPKQCAAAVRVSASRSSSEQSSISDFAWISHQLLALSLCDRPMKAFARQQTLLVFPCQLTAATAPSQPRLRRDPACSQHPGGRRWRSGGHGQGHLHGRWPDLSKCRFRDEDAHPDRGLRASVDQGRVPRAASATGVGVRCTLICCRVPTDLYSDR